MLSGRWLCRQPGHEPLRVDAELRKVRLYDLRHTYASLLLQDGVELYPRTAVAR